MSADDYPDFDLSFLDGTTGSDLTGLSRGLDTSATAVSRAAAAVHDTAEGKTVERVHGDLVSIRQALTSASDKAGAAAAAFAAMRDAWEKWKANAPKQAEIAAAEQAVAAARERLKTANDRDAPARRDELKKAEGTLRDLITRREAADAALADALDRAKAKLAPGEGGLHREKKLPTPPGSQHTPSSTPDKPSAPTPAPSAPATAPSATAPSATAPSAAAPADGKGSLSPATAAALGAALATPQPAAQAPQHQAAPALTPAPAGAPVGGPQPGNRPGERDRKPIGTDDLPELLVAAGLGTAGLGAAANTVPAAVTAAAPPASPGAADTPAAPLTATAPANPTGTGTSTANLVTTSNVSGRPDNIASASPYAPNPGATATASHLAEAQAGGSSANGSPAGTAAGTGQAATAAGTPMGTPMVGPLGGAGGGAAGAREPVTAKLTETQKEVLGLNTLAEAVPGGTIAQRRDDED